MQSPRFLLSDLTRRRFLIRSGALGLMGLFCGSLVRRLYSEVSLESPSGSASNSLPIKNRAPLGANAFYALPLGSIRPAGWLRTQLEIQARGLSGHLDETWADVGPNSGWLGGSGESWERGPYYVDGLVPLAYLLDDSQLKSKAQRYIDWTLEHTDSQGMIGPRSNDDWWPRMVMLKALTQYQEATGDSRVMPVLSNYFAYQLKALQNRPLRDWGHYRWQDEALTVIWLYNRIGDPRLMQLLELLYKQGYDWKLLFSDFQYTQRTTPESIGLKENSGLTGRGMQTHGVNIAMAIKMSPVWSLVSGQETDRNAVFPMLEKLDRYHGLPNGIFSADEHLAGRNPSQGTELCTVVETMFSLEQSLAILGDASLGDRLERLAFNALPGAFNDNMWAHQYNQQPNQIEVSLQSKPWTTDGPESNLYGLDPNFGCCAANFHQGWPKFTASLFMLSADDGLAATAYAPCQVTTAISGVKVHVTEETDYPFRGGIQFTVNPESPIAFPLRLRIPAWASGTSIQINGKKIPPVQCGTFVRLERTWREGDTVSVEFPLAARALRGFQNSISLERGPLVFAYAIGEDWLKLRDRGMTADWQVYPTTQWNYALAVNPENASRDITVQETNVGEAAFTKAGAPVKLEVNARKVPSWVAVDAVADPVPQSPMKSDEAEEKIILIPYAAAKLRVTSFPQLET